MSINKNLPSFETLFGDLDFKKGDEGRSVYSPAAYLADLLQLLEDNFKFDEGNLEGRRTDIAGELQLNTDNTFKPVPYLDIVNRLLASKVEVVDGAKVGAFDILKGKKFPFNLPFDLENERYKQLLAFVNTKGEELYKLFLANSLEDATTVAKEFLGLSMDEFQAIIYTPDSTATASYVDEYYGLDNGKPKLENGKNTTIEDVEVFTKNSGLTGTELRQLLWQNLSETAKQTTNESTTELAFAANFFINQSTDKGYAALNQQETKLVWKPLSATTSGSLPLPMTWFVKASQFIRLSKKVGISFEELDLILRSCCGNELNATALQRIAVIKHIHKAQELPIDVVCSLFSDIHVYGIGNEKEPADLFNRILNQKFATLEKKHLHCSEYTPVAFSSYEQLACKGDVLSDENAAFRKRLQSALSISQKNFTLIIERYRQKYGEQQHLFSAKQPFGLQAISLLHRIAKLTEILDIAYLELFELLDIIEKDPSIRKFAQFNVLINYEPSELDCYRILECNHQHQEGQRGNALHDAFWLVQILISLGKWMQASDFSTEELKKILTGEHRTEKEKEAASTRKATFLNELYNQFKTVALSERSFESPLFDYRTSKHIHRHLLSNGDDLLSAKDNRLVNFDKGKADAAAHGALSNLERLHPNDFVNIGLEEKMLDKIYYNLTIKGYIDEEGSLVEDAFPTNPDEFRINFKGDEGAMIFSVINDLYLAEAARISEEGGNLELSVYISDFEELGLDASRKLELYDNLYFNGYIDEQGFVLQPDLFSDIENLPAFEINAGLDGYSKDVHAVIQKSMEGFERDKLKLDAEIFAELPLKEIEKQDLIENLIFNEYIDKSGNYRDKGKMLGLAPKDFNLALAYYPHRQAILKAIKAQILEFKKQYYALNREMFAEVANKIVADLIFKFLEEEVLVDGIMEAEAVEFFNTPENSEELAIGPYFSSQHTQVVFNTIAQINQNAGQYKVKWTDFEAIGLVGEEIEDLLQMLENGGFLLNYVIPQDKIPFFLNINNAVLFEIDGYEDYEKDIFFVFHAIAKVVDGATQEIAGRLKLFAEAQETVLLNSLQDYLEMPGTLAKSVCGHIWHNHKHLVEEFMLPVLGAVDEHSQLVTEPKNNKFNFGLKRAVQFSTLASKLGLGEKEVDVVFRDQDLAQKFPEKLVLPIGVTGFDALLYDTIDGTKSDIIDSKEVTEVIYMFVGGKFYVYNAHTFKAISGAHELGKISPLLAGQPQVDAAFKDAKGNAWVIAGEKYCCKEANAKEWTSKQMALGKVANNFEDPMQVQATYKDEHGRTFLFAGDQYVRYSTFNYDIVDEGYPKKIKSNWNKEIAFSKFGNLSQPIDAGFYGQDVKSYLFTGTHFVTFDNPSVAIPINEFWGKLNNKFEGIQKIEAGTDLDGNFVFYADGQSLEYSDSLENAGVLGNEGSLKKHTYNPDLLEPGLDAVFKGFDNNTYYFKNGFYTSSGAPGERKKIEEKWGIVENNLMRTGLIDAALSGLDGRTYLFCGHQYFRYSTEDYTFVDEGYPRSISKDWAGLTNVDTAFVLDGKTYLFGRNPEGQPIYIRFSTNDYKAVDAGYPKTPDDNWWNFPVSLTESAEFNMMFDAKPFLPDAAFIGPNGKTYLFKGNKFISFDHNHRWWSEPQLLAEKWDSIPFETVGAAFTGKDGKSYIFEGPQPNSMRDERSFDFDKSYVVYSGNQHEKVDDTYPRQVMGNWGIVRNNIVRHRKLDAALTLAWQDPKALEAAATPYTYLFSGNQFFRYTGVGYYTVDEGYPKTIKTALKEEPCFANLDAVLEHDIDAAFADQRNIYLFKANKYHVVSTAGYKAYGGRFNARSFAPFLEEGSMHLRIEYPTGNNAQGWHKIGNIEAKGELKMMQKSPAIFRGIPAEYQHFTNQPDAILQGVDGSTYIFKGEKCYNDNLERDYPLAEEWGRVNNNIEVENQIDAVLTGADGKIYVFSGDQFVSYQKPADGTDTPDFTGTSVIFTEGLPKSIKDHWGGLEHVHIAFVKDNKTYLLERPNEEGIFRYLCLETDNYDNLKDAQIHEADFSWWNVPEEYINEGFTEVDAVLFDDEHTFLFRDKSFIQFNNEDGLWTYERPMDRIWRDIPFNDPKFNSIRTVFSGNKGEVYFFSDETFSKYKDKAFSKPEEIRLKLGIIDNAIVQQKRVDAAFVLDNQTTYLFAGGQYVRYSTDDYRFVDEGYPKQIAGNLRKEEGFSNLPATFDELMSKAQGHERRIDGIIANAGNVYIFENTNCHVISRSLNRTYDIAQIGKLKNNIANTGKVDAAFVGMDGTYLISGDQVYRYQSTPYKFVDMGFPQSISSVYSGQGGQLSPNFQYNLDAAIFGQNGLTYLFKGKEFVETSQPGSVHLIKEKWGKVNNPFRPSASTENIGLDAAFIATDGSFYIFKGKHYGKYASFGNDHMEEGYPLQLENNWGNLPNSYEDGINGAFVFDEKTYLLKSMAPGLEEYVRYSDSSYATMDSIYPQRFVSRWNNWNDFLLDDIRIIHRYIQLLNEQGSAEHSLTDLFYSGNGYKKDPYSILSSIFEWEVEEVKWLKRRNAFIRPENQFEVNFNLELVLNMHNIFRSTKKMGASPSDVYNQVWVARHQASNTKLAADSIYRYLGLNNSEKDWKTISSQLHSALNVMKRDALVPYVVHITPNVFNVRELSNLLLIDVEMGPEAMTSNVKEAISAMQLFIHRYFVNLEQHEEVDEATRNNLKTWWKWMRNYRVWEANRKVFLYPENYIRPELRDTKTVAFKTLEDDLLQGEMTENSVEKAFKKYLDYYTEVSRLKIVGGYSYTLPARPNINQLIFFGLTRTSPERFFYRTAAFDNGATNRGSWNPWLEVNVKIESDKVYPVYAFGRMFVFWAKSITETKNPDNAVVNFTQTNDTTHTAKSENPDKRDVLRIHFSYYNLNKEWAPVQTLQVGNSEDDKKELALEHKEHIQDIKLYIENSTQLGDFDYENIVIKCKYNLKSTTPQFFTVPPSPMPGPDEKYFFFNQFFFDAENKIKWGIKYVDTIVPQERTFRLKPDLLAETDPQNLVFPSPNIGALLSIFKQGENVNPNTIIQLNTIENSTDGPWFSFDHKGGSFLAKPSESGLSSAHQLKRLNEDFRLPKLPWTKVDAAFKGPDGYNYFFQNVDTSPSGPQYQPIPSKVGMSKTAANRKWGIPQSDLKTVKAIYNNKETNQTFVFGEKAFYTYSNGMYDFADDIGARPNHEHHLSRDIMPNFKFGMSNNIQDIDAILEGGDGKTYFIEGASYIDSDSFTTAKPVAELWGKAKIANSFTATDARVIGAIAHKGNTYLFTETEYVKYSNNKYEAIDPGYPKPNNFKNLLEEMDVKTTGLQIGENETVVSAYNDFNLDEGRILRDLSNFFNFFVGSRGAGKNMFLKTSTGNAYTLSGDKLESAQNRANENFEQVLSRAIEQMTPTVKIETGLWGNDDNFYLFFDNMFATFTKTDTVHLSQFFEGNLSRLGKPNYTKWGHNIPQGFDWENLSAAHHDTVKRRTYFFSKDQYLSMPDPDQEGRPFYEFIDAGYPKKLVGNPDGMPNWEKMDAAFIGADGKAYFFKDTKFAVGDNLEQEAEIDSKWGLVSNKIMKEGVDAAISEGNNIYLIRKDDIVRYTVGANNAIPDKIDIGFPKKLPPSVTIDAVAKIRSKTYLFSGGSYASVGSMEELLTPNRMLIFKPIKGNWGNLPMTMKTGIDAALNDGKLLYFFKGNNFVKYGSEPANVTPIFPYEIGIAVYDIIRLSTSTAYKLNTTLFEGGVTALLRKETQQVDETPAFSKKANANSQDPTTIALNEERVRVLPSHTFLDFDSSNGIYYWEIFFHVPYMIAQSLNTNQKFEESKKWYEYIFDPTMAGDYWKFLPFFSLDVASIITTIDQKLAKVENASTNPIIVDLKDKLWNAAPYFTGEKAFAANEDKSVLVIDTTNARNFISTIDDAKTRNQLLETMGVIDRLKDQHNLLNDTESQLATYANDPFDPHAIASLRKIAYRKAIVMAYIDNLLDWGDMLFQQYTQESINEARMLYTLGHDLLGDKPEGLGNVLLTPDTSYKGLDTEEQGETNLDILIEIENGMATSNSPNIVLSEQGPVRVHDSILNLYFYIPENERFIEYWNRVEDRLYKIRQSLNMQGEKQPLPLFEPPIDPMSIVQAIGSGASIGQALQVGQAVVPHYRFEYMLSKAKELAQQLERFGETLLTTLEKKDSETLSMMQSNYEGMILEQTRRIKAANLEEAEMNIASLNWSLKNAETRRKHYNDLIEQGMLGREIAQLALMSIGAGLHFASGITKIVAAIVGGAAPDALLGPFIMGVKYGGSNISDSIGKAAEVLEGFAEGFSMTGEALGVAAQFERMEEDWKLQLLTANNDVEQIKAQVNGAKIQKLIAQYEIANLEKQIEEGNKIGDFMRDKFTNQQLYQWMASQLSGLFYQTYKMAFDMAKSAEKALQYERGLKESDVNFIQPVHWDSQRQGLLSGSRLGLDLNRMELYHLQTDKRRFELTKQISLIDLDPMAFMQLKTKGYCEFSFTESLFDYDFPGHYCRQMKTISLTFDMGEGVFPNATLTQLNHKTVMEPDPKAVKFLMEPKDSQPLSIRSDWRPNQQVALSHVDQYEKNNGLFELNFNDSRYLPFEGTGAVSTWRLELNGKKSAQHLDTLVDMTINLKYTALPGGEQFASTVKGMLKPYQTYKLIDLNFDFNEQWLAFLDSDSDELELMFYQQFFPEMAASKINTIYSKFDLVEQGQVSIVLNHDDSMVLKDGKFTEPNGLSIRSQGSKLHLKFKGDKRMLKTVYLIMGYKAKV